MRHSIAIPADSFFKEASKEYSGGLSKRLCLELIQNSSDAGATKIDFTFDDSTKTLVIRDTGSGMDRDTLVNGMLTFGGSIKQEGNTGFFGAAKKLILFSHKSYKIRTQDLVAEGELVSYSLREVEEFKDCILGTEITIEFAEFWPDYNELQDNLGNAILFVMSRSNIKAKVTWQGETVKQAELHPIDLEYDTHSIRKGPVSNSIIVRFNGLYMFSQWSNHSYIFECKGSSKDSLTQNREGFRQNTPWKDAYTNFLNTLANNNRSGIAAEVSYRKHKDTAKIIDGIIYMGNNLPNKMSKREKSIFALCTVVGRMVGFDLTKYNFGFFLDDQFAGLGGGNDGKIWMNPNSFSGENWERDCVETFIHELTHHKGHWHDEGFIQLFGEMFKQFTFDEFSGINPLKAATRKAEKEIFG